MPHAASWLFVLGAFAIRLPLLFALDLHGDEQTFLNVGHDVALGHLPYLHGFWELKPPVLFFVLAPVTIIADHKIWIVRLFATIFDATTGVLIKKTADLVFGEHWSHWLC